MSTFIDVLVAGIGGAAGRRAEMLHEEVSLLRKHSLAQLQEQNQHKLPEQRVLSAFGAIDSLVNAEQLDQEQAQQLKENPAAAISFTQQADVQGILKSLEERSTEQGRIAGGVHELSGMGSAIRTDSEERALGSDQEQVARQVYASLVADGWEGPEPDWSSPRAITNFMNTPAAQGMLEAAREAEGLHQRDKFGIAQARGRERARETEGEIFTALERDIFQAEGQARGLSRVAETQIMEQFGLRSTDVDEIGSIARIMEPAKERIIDENMQFWRQDTPSSRYVSDVLDQYLVDRADELMREEGMLRNEVENQLLRESALIRRMDLEGLAEGNIRTGREVTESGAEYDRSQIAAGVQRIRQTVLEGEQPREAPTPAPADTESPVIGTLMDDSPSVTGDDVPEMLARPEAPVAPRGATPEVSEDGRVSLSPSGSVIGHELEIIETAANILRQGMESDDPQERGRSEANALRLIAENTTSVQRNGLSPQQYLSALRQQIIEGR